MSTKQEGWHVDKRITIGVIIGTLLLLGTMGTAVSSFDTRVSLVEREVQDITVIKDDIREIKDIVIRLETRQEDRINSVGKKVE